MKTFISFPPGMVAGDAVRIPLLANGGRFYVLNKPAGMNACQERRLGGGERAIATAIQARAEEGAGQFVRLGIDKALAVHFPAREVSGVFLFAKDNNTRAALKNDLGSLRFEFVYHFLADDAPDKTDITCDLPLAVDRREPVAFVSHKTGKKTQTHFRRLRETGALSLWEAVSAFDRLHQVRVHAAESGIRLTGETLYHPGFRPAKPRLPPASTPSSPATIYLHLRSLTFPWSGSLNRVEAEYPHSFEKQLRRLEKPAGSGRDEQDPNRI